MSTPKRRHKWDPDPARIGRAYCLHCGMVMDTYRGTTGPRAEFRTSEFRFIANYRATAPQPPCEPKPKESNQ